jgi:Flp pilus assembly protein TadG
MVKRFRERLARRARQWCGCKTVRRLVRQEDGSTAIEFGLVAMPFLALVFAIIETAIVFFAGQALETAVADSSRLIMTGQAQTQGLSKATFKENVCSRIYGLFDCAAGINVDVQTFSSFSAVNLTSPLDGAGNLDLSSFKYQPGGPNDIVVVRLIYQWPVYISLLGLSDMAGGKRLMIATAAFRNEPYQ